MGLPYWRAALAAAALAFASFAVPASPAGTVWAADAAAAKDDEDEDEYEGLPPGAGRDEVFGYCSACHSIRLVTQQGLTRADWGEVLVYMVEEHEMAEIEPEDEKLVLDYLARFYGRDRRARKMGH